MNATFEIDSPRGSAFGMVDTDWEISGSEITFRGTATFTGGTGRYRGIRGEELKAFDRNALDGQSGVLRLRGFARF